MADGHTDTYDHARILDMAVPVGDGFTLTAFLLPKGATAWNPTSTKPEKVLHGPLALTYLIHPSGVDIKGYPADGRCTAHSQPGNVRCENDAVGDTIRCAEHEIRPNP
jgi:hypothetical protein